MRNVLRFEIDILLGIFNVVMCFFYCCSQCLSMYWCNFHYNCVRFYTLNCAIIIVLVFLLVLFIFLIRFIQNRTIARMIRDAQHRQRRPLKNG